MCEHVACPSAFPRSLHDGPIQQHVLCSRPSTHVDHARLAARVVVAARRSVSFVWRARRMDRSLATPCTDRDLQLPAYALVRLARKRLALHAHQRKLVGPFVLIGGQLVLTIGFLPIVAVQTNGQWLVGRLFVRLFFNATSEELLFRGWLYNNLTTSTRRGMVLVAIVTSILFGLLHTLDGRHWAWLILTAAHGLAWSGLRIRTQSVYPSICAHLLSNWSVNDVLNTDAPLSSGNTIMYVAISTLFYVLFFAWCVRTLRGSELGKGTMQGQIESAYLST